ncbi:hypothetical protein [Rugamonas aquatica]|uniref:Transmembrane protein n=1 Tax=Rugamonas aquatica TaxID=2743357 RepID=A0A6A7N6E4_9BURK|nr:hypothetical protein [Rugamonas aquatica]MQA40695.1 hypothetical protein [Rugamonas aquatica]
MYNDSTHTSRASISATSFGPYVATIIPHFENSVGGMSCRRVTLFPRQAGKVSAVVSQSLAKVAPTSKQYLTAQAEQTASPAPVPEQKADCKLPFDSDEIFESLEAACKAASNKQAANWSPFDAYPFPNQTPDGIVKEYTPEEFDVLHARFEQLKLAKKQQEDEEDTLVILAQQSAERLTPPTAEASTIANMHGTEKPALHPLPAPEGIEALYKNLANTVQLARMNAKKKAKERDERLCENLMLAVTPTVVASGIMLGLIYGVGSALTFGALLLAGAAVFAGAALIAGAIKMLNWRDERKRAKAEVDTLARDIKQYNLLPPNELEQMLVANSALRNGEYAAARVLASHLELPADDEHHKQAMSYLANQGVPASSLHLAGNDLLKAIQGHLLLGGA